MYVDEHKPQQKKQSKSKLNFVQIPATCGAQTHTTYVLLPSKLDTEDKH